MTHLFDTIIIGAGQSGLAAAYALQNAHQTFTILEADHQVGGGWRHYYESLKLFSPAAYSSLPGLPLSGDPNRYPRRDEIVDYLERYAATFDFPIERGAKVVNLQKDLKGDRFEVELENGEVRYSRTVVVASGSFKNPYLPKLPGQATFGGQIMHASEYINPSPFSGKRVIVVGGRNSAIQIGAELAQVAEVTLASKVPIGYVPQQLLGKDIHFWLTQSGIDMLPVGQWFGLSLKESVVDDGRYRAALEKGMPARRPMFSAFKPGGVVWENGGVESVDSVIFATGYRPNLPFLSDLEEFDETDRPRQKGGISRTIDGLYYIGLPWQRSHRSATLRGVGSDAAYVVQQLLGDLKSIKMGDAGHRIDAI